MLCIRRIKYLLLKGKDLSEKKIADAIMKYTGMLGYAKASPMIVKKGKSSMIISINRSEIDKVRASFVLCSKGIEISKVSGVVNKLK
jgi:RNase P/RNase MRP subunit POP5